MKRVAISVTQAFADAQPVGNTILDSFNWVGSVIIPGVVASLCSSIIFLIGMRVLSPKIEVSPQIALGKSEGSNEASVPRVKIINRGFRDIHDVKVECYFQWTKKHAGSKSQISKVKITDSYTSGAPFITVEGRKLNDDEFDNCVRVRLKGKDDKTLKQAWDRAISIDHNAILVVSVSARDSWSGVIRTRRQEYLDYDSTVVRGEFVVGNTFEITRL